MRASCHGRYCAQSVRVGGRRKPIAEVSRFAYPKQSQTTQFRREYAHPAKLDGTNLKAAFRQPPPPTGPGEQSTVEDGHVPGQVEDAAGLFDAFLAETAFTLNSEDATSVSTLWSQYRERGGQMCDYVVAYEERPPTSRRADMLTKNRDEAGDGVVMVVHALFKSSGRLETICACSGFVVDARPLDREENDGEVVITCAHTLEEMYNTILRHEGGNQKISMSFVIPASGKARRVQQVLSSIPRSDVISMQLEPTGSPETTRWKSLPLSPFPVYSGMNVLTHLFGASDVPEAIRSQSRLPPSAKEYTDRVKTETPIKWLNDQAWRRWGAGNMLGYRSYSNIEVEAGIHSSLPHILTSILPSPGSSGGPLVCAETGAVVGMISGRRMDNRVEGERGWGASSESIFEMFSLPGFMPLNSASSNRD